MSSGCPTWTTHTVPGVQVAYIARVNLDLPAERMIVAPCAGVFPSLGVTMTPDPAAVDVTVRLAGQVHAM